MSRREARLVKNSVLAVRQMHAAAARACERKLRTSKPSHVARAVQAQRKSRRFLDIMTVAARPGTGLAAGSEALADQHMRPTEPGQPQPCAS